MAQDLEISVNLERYVVSGLFGNPYLVSVLGSEITDAYFKDPSSKIIYKSLMNHKSEYGSTPNTDELNLAIESNYINLGTPIEDVKAVSRELLDKSSDIHEKHLIDKATEFIKKYKSNQVLNKAIDVFNSGNIMKETAIVSELAAALDVNLSKSELFTLSNVETLTEARTKALGVDGSNAIVKSVLPSINESLQYSGYQKGTLNLIVSPPGCFTGDTEIMTLDGKTKTLKYLHDTKEKIGIYGSSKEGDLVPGMADSIYLSKYTKDLIEVTIDDTNKIKCTPDHPFMLRTGEYKKAEDLSVTDELMPVTREYSQIRPGSKDYEVIVNKDGHKKFTHRSVAETWIDRPEDYSIVHHDDNDRFNNHVDNLVWLKDSSEHAKLHYDRGDFSSWIENGKVTRFNSERTREMNLENWKDEDYRDRMREVSRDNGKKYGAAQLNGSATKQEYRRKCKSLSFVNKVIKKHPDITVNNYDSIASTITGRKTWLIGVAKAYHCTVNGDMSRKASVDYEKLSTIWSTVLDEARYYNHKVTGVRKLTLDKEVPVYGVVDAGKHANYALALNNTEGVIVSNTGKTSYMINEGAYAALQGFSVLHVFLGDMIPYDGFVRYMSNITGRLQKDIVHLSNEEQEMLIEQCNQNYPNVLDRINVLSYGAGEIGVEALIENVERLQDKRGENFDMIIIDYADNFKKDNTQMYNEGGDIYDKLALLGRMNGSVMMVASQPKIQYWNQEIIPLEGAAESSKKQHIVDLMMTFNLAARGENLGTMFIPKVRRGTSGRVIRVETAWERCSLQEIKEEDYAAKKANKGIV